MTLCRCVRMVLATAHACMMHVHGHYWLMILKWCRDIYRYYTLFDREHKRIGFAKRGDCTPETPVEVPSTSAAHCAARTAKGCAQCVGPVDDLEPGRGYHDNVCIAVKREIC